ncbi:MAG TPA: hypothetical protein VML92_05850 [Steroidobacteraceae bacterium]|nr:hypothetical protein [Steroidobacteraceae bacterium]
MSYEMTVTEKPGYLHVVLTGQNTLENVELYLKQLTRESATRGFTRVLIEEKLTGRRLETWDVYQIASQGSIGGSGQYEALAYVDHNAHGDLMRFAETVANNRGIPLNVFTTVQEAAAWLQNKS